MLAPVAIWMTANGATTTYAVPAVVFFGLPAAALAGTAVMAVKVEKLIKSKRHAPVIHSEYDTVLAQYNAQRAKRSKNTL